MSVQARKSRGLSVSQHTAHSDYHKVRARNVELSDARLRSAEAQLHAADREYRAARVASLRDYRTAQLEAITDEYRVARLDLGRQEHAAARLREQRAARRQLASSEHAGAVATRAKSGKREYQLALLDASEDEYAATARYKSALESSKRVYSSAHLESSKREYSSALVDSTNRDYYYYAAAEGEGAIHLCEGKGGTYELEEDVAAGTEVLHLGRWSPVLSPRVKRSRHLRILQDHENLQPGYQYYVPIYRSRLGAAASSSSFSELSSTSRAWQHEHSHEYAHESTLQREQQHEQHEQQQQLEEEEQQLELELASKRRSAYRSSYLFANELESVEESMWRSRQIIRERADLSHIRQQIHTRSQVQKRMSLDGQLRAPHFTVRLRSHTIWERMNVKFTSTVDAWPEVKITWYKNNVPISSEMCPEKYRVESRFGVNTLEISRCDFDDTAQYSISAINVKGEASCFASLVVKRFRGALEEGSGYHEVSTMIPSHFDIHLMDKFQVSFGKEGDTLSLGCTVLLHPSIPGFHPTLEWYRDDVLLEDSKWVETSRVGERGTITLRHLNKEDEGLYTLRVVAGLSYDQYSAYVFVRDGKTEVEGAPGAALEVACEDINKDYVIVTWKHPSDDHGSPVIGYFVDRREVGTNQWVQCNDAPVRFARLPVTGLAEGHSYEFRVRSVNSRGVGPASRSSEPVLVADPTARAHHKEMPTAPWTGQIMVTEEEPEEGTIPGPPTALSVTEATKDYVVLSWKPPSLRGSEGLVYYVEKMVGSSGLWQRENLEMPLKSPRYATFSLDAGEAYHFRVRASNSCGISEPSEATGPVSVGDRLDVPGAPARPLATRNTKTSVQLAWDAVETEGELLGYYVDAREEGTGVWVPCNNKPIQGTRFIAQGLTTGKRYEFRVKAINAAGPGPHSPSSEPITVYSAIRGGILDARSSPPSSLTLLESRGDAMLLGWKAPHFSGGADVTGYFVDFREVDGDAVGPWREANARPVPEQLLWISHLQEGVEYQFRVRAVNLAGVSLPSVASAGFLCEEWTMPTPGPSYDLIASEVREDSLLLQWRAPTYTGTSAVTGYWVDVCEASCAHSESAWATVNQQLVQLSHMRVTGLEEGKSYVLRVRAENAAGVGKSSNVTEPILARTPPGTSEIVADVDDDGNIFLELSCAELDENSKFKWSKEYEELIDSGRVAAQTVGDKGRLYFTDATEEDLGVYSCIVTDTDGISSSFILDKDELQRLKEISHERKQPTIPLLSELAVELMEKGRVRFWLQAERLGPDSTVTVVFNDKELSSGEKYDVKVTRSEGLVEMFMEELTQEDEGTYTVQIEDGRASGQSSLVLIGDAFAKLLKEAAFQRAEYFRKQGPHFAEYLRWEVTDECNVLLICKVANINKMTSIVWYKDAQEIMVDEDHDFDHGICTLLITQVTKRDAGVYEVRLKDDRGKDISILRLIDDAYDAMMQEVCRISAESASELKLQATAEGIKLYSVLKYCPEELKFCWYQRDTKLASTDKTRSGVVSDQLYVQIYEPTDKDKGKYTMELFDGKGTHKRTVDVAGQAFDDAYAEFLRLKAAAIAEKNRARVVGGLPDVVTIQEGKTLNLTCDLWGEPTPEVAWLRNDRELHSDEHFVTKFESGRYASFTINGVSTADSGKYSVYVKNKYGAENGDFTVVVARAVGEIRMAMCVSEVSHPAPGPQPEEPETRPKYQATKPKSEKGPKKTTDEKKKPPIDVNNGDDGDDDGTERRTAEESDVKGAQPSA
ncbi:myomesin-1-like isoform X1 [Petromyzon marinus]|uniref:myomesin-1-like isoform X1 n=1 Tax=Petromyzon marinus TaxID=7757 RepID=UPI003F725093